uniref:PTTG1 interacting protein n=1 Tax=Prolemur simus TaxID=1328070 RepID=A0A8C8YTU3_PROSS
TSGTPAPLRFEVTLRTQGNGALAAAPVLDAGLTQRAWIPVNFEALIIAMSVVGAAILLGIAVCCCCCCRRKRRRELDKSDEKEMREREERRMRQEERRAEMKLRHDEIRRKYGKNQFCFLFSWLGIDARLSQSLLMPGESQLWMWATVSILWVHSLEQKDASFQVVL